MNIVWCNFKIVVKSFFLKELYCEINSKLNWTVCVYWLKYSRYPSESKGGLEPSALDGDVTSELVEGDWEQGWQIAPPLPR